MPDAVERSASAVSAGAVSGRGRAQEEERCPIVIACNYFGKDSIINSERYSHILVRMPGCALVVGNCDVRMPIMTYIAEIQTAFRSNSNRGIARPAGAAGPVLHCEGKTIVTGNNPSLCVSTVFVGDIHNPARAHLDMPMQPAAIDKRVHRMSGLVG